MAQSMSAVGRSGNKGRDDDGKIAQLRATLLPLSVQGSRATSRNESRDSHSDLPSPGAGTTGELVAKPDRSDVKLVVVMVGLPARGKSYMSNKLTRYLNWLEFQVKVFNVGQMRRELSRQLQEETGSRADHRAGFFDHKNANAQERREWMADQCLENLITWLREGGNVGIHDATNTTKKRRRRIYDQVKRHGLSVLFLESIATAPEIIAANIMAKMSANDPDYAHVSRAEAEADFRARIRNYEEQYEPMDGEGRHSPENDLTFAKLINVGQQVVVNRIDGYLQSRAIFYLMNLHIKPRSLYFSRHGESMYNLEGKIGGDSDLSPSGRLYAQSLPRLVKEKINRDDLTVWTSTLRRTVQTAEALPHAKLAWKSLDELDAGVCDGLTYEEIEEHFPEDYASRDDDKYNYRYRGGESYRDVCNRLEPVILELERSENVLVVCHQAVIRCFYAYFNNLSQAELPYIKIPLHTIIKLTPKAYGCDEERFPLDIPAVDTHRPKPVLKSGVGTPVRPPASPSRRNSQDARIKPGSSLHQSMTPEEA